MLRYDKSFLLSIGTVLCLTCNKPPTSTGVDSVATSTTYAPKPFDTIGAKVHEKELSDWGKLTRVTPGFPFVEPENTESVSRIVGWASQNKVTLRVRGRGHSMDGRSLPRPGELLVLTHRLNQMKKVQDDLIEVGAGCSIYAINQWLAKFGKTLPVHNDGLVGPSLGGFISAGGIGRGSRHHGGFWNNVEQITLVDGLGQLRVIKKTDGAFPWLFGSMGQLGIIVSAQLKVIVEEGKTPSPLPDAAVIEETWKKDAAFAARTEDSYKSEHLYWFSVFAPANEEKNLRVELEAMRKRNGANLIFMPEYYWPMKFQRFTPPLLFNSNADFVCIGIWGHIDPATPHHEKKRRVLALEEDITGLLRRHPSYRRYIQSEVIPSAARLRSYFGNEIRSKIRAIKRDYDPQGIMNPIAGFLTD